MRQRADMTQEELATASGFNVRTIQKIENGEVDLNKSELGTYVKILNALGMNVVLESK